MPSFWMFQPITSESVDLPSIISEFRQFDRLVVFVLKNAGYTVPAPFCMAAVVDSKKAWSIQRGGKPVANSRWSIVWSRGSIVAKKKVHIIKISKMDHAHSGCCLVATKFHGHFCLGLRLVRTRPPGRHSKGAAAGANQEGGPHRWQALHSCRHRPPQCAPCRLEG